MRRHPTGESYSTLWRDSPNPPTRRDRPHTLHRLGCNRVHSRPPSPVCPLPRALPLDARIDRLPPPIMDRDQRAALRVGQADPAVGGFIAPGERAVAGVDADGGAAAIRRGEGAILGGSGHVGRGAIRMVDPPDDVVGEDCAGTEETDRQRGEADFGDDFHNGGIWLLGVLLTIGGQAFPVASKARQPSAANAHGFYA